MRRACLALSFGLLFLGCGREKPPEPLLPAVYHWQTHFDPKGADSLPLFVKIFDVVLANGRPEPTAILRGEIDRPIVPVIFITNGVFEQLTTIPAIRDLARSVLTLTNEVVPRAVTGLQVDCDWTAGTRAAYFAFLKALRAQSPDLELSVTIRLHQYGRWRGGQGIPPVDYGVLMAYNVGQLSHWTETNSIVDTGTIKDYLAGYGPYPIPLDIAVAAYDWAAVYRRDRLVYLSNEPPLNELRDTSRFQPLDPGGLRYEVRQGTYLDGLYLYAGDLVRREIADADLARRTARLVRTHIGHHPGQRQLVYRLHSRQFSAAAFVWPPPAAAPR